MGLQHLKNMSLKISLSKWNYYPKDEASWELENKFKQTYPNFVIEDNDLFGEERNCNGLIGKWNIEDDEICWDGCPRLRSVEKTSWWMRSDISIIHTKERESYNEMIHVYI